MLNTGRRREAFESLRNSTVAYHDALAKMHFELAKLYHLRQTVVAELVEPFVNCITRISNPPRQLEKAVARLEEAVSIFNDSIVHATERSRLGNWQSVEESSDTSGDELATNRTVAWSTSGRVVLTGQSVPVVADDSEFNAAVALLEEAGIPLTLDDGLNVAKGALVGWLSPAELVSTGWSIAKVGFAVNSRNKQMAEAAEKLNSSVVHKTWIFKTASEDARRVSILTETQLSHVSGRVDRLAKLHPGPTDFNISDRRDKELVNSLTPHTLELAKLLNMKVTLLQGFDAFVERALTWFRSHENICPGR